MLNICTKIKLFQKNVYWGNETKFCFAIRDMYGNDGFKNKMFTRKLVILKMFPCGTQDKQRPTV